MKKYFYIFKIICIFIFLFVLTACSSEDKKEVAQNEVKSDVTESKEDMDNHEEDQKEEIKEEPKEEPKEKPKETIPSNAKPNQPEEKPTYIGGILIANKTYPLPSNYNPGANAEALEAFKRMKNDAEAQGLSIYISSGFRSYLTQKEVYESFVKSYGQATADTFSARPGYSEHQTGLAFDLNSIDSSFTKTPECDWVKNNAHKYGFIVRYPLGKENITGYKYEPWHIRYLGEKKAVEVFNSGLCLEEYLGITSKYS